MTAGRVRAVYESMDSAGQQARKAKAQRRVAVRSLCRRCNSDLLGHRYDPALADFCRQARTAADGVLQLPAELGVRIRPTAVMRSVLGHMAAREANRYQKGPITEPLRDFILDAALPLPEIMNFYYWFYPHRRQVFVRDAALLVMGTGDPFTFWLLKFFPLAFMVTFDTQIAPAKAHSLNFFRTAQIDAEYDVPLRLRPAVHELWPEHPTDSAAIMYGQGAHIAESIQRVRR